MLCKTMRTIQNKNTHFREYQQSLLLTYVTTSHYFCLDALGFHVTSKTNPSGKRKKRKPVCSYCISTHCITHQNSNCQSAYATYVINLLPNILIFHHNPVITKHLAGSYTTLKKTERADCICKLCWFCFTLRLI